MKLSVKQIRSHLNSGPSPSWSERRLAETIHQSKIAFYESESEGTLSRAEFLYQQSRYIHKYLWILQGCVLLLLWFLLHLSGSSFFLRRCMGVAAPLFAVLLLPELWKNRNANALEIEGTACYSLRQIYGARIFLFALVDLFFLCLFSMAAVRMGRMPVEELMIQFFLPYLVTCCICFRTLYSPRINSEAFAILLCMVWSFLWVQFLQEKIYEAISLPLWISMTILAALYLGYCIQRGQKECGTIWEVKASWN